MDKSTLLSLEKVNQLALTDAERESVLAFFAQQDALLPALNAIDTSDVERMVHVLPIPTFRKLKSWHPVPSLHGK